MIKYFFGLKYNAFASFFVWSYKNTDDAHTSENTDQARLKLDKRVEEKDSAHSGQPVSRIQRRWHTNCRYTIYLLLFIIIIYSERSKNVLVFVLRGFFFLYRP